MSEERELKQVALNYSLRANSDGTTTLIPAPGSIIEVGAPNHPVTLEIAKKFLRIDFDDDDSLINSLIGAADLFIVNACGEKVNKMSELYRLASQLLITHWYFNRDVVGTDKKMAFSIDAILFQLKYEVSST